MVDKDIKVSIILPIYNVGKYFGECMESVLSQTHSNIEVILVDDGSTDNSGEIADRYAARDKRIKVIHQANAGVSTARNVGIAAASGKYVCFSDPDDILKKDYVEYMLAMCEENHADVSVCAEVFTTFMPNQCAPCVEVVSGEEAAVQILYGKITVGCYSKMFSKTFLDTNNIHFFEDVYIGEGFNFNVLAFCSASKVVVSQHKVYYYRLDNSTSAMNKFNVDKCSMGLEAINIMRKNLRIKSKKLNDAVDYADWSTHGSMYDWMVMAKVKHLYPEMYKRCLTKTHKLSVKAFFSPTTAKGKIVALLRILHPFLWAYLRVNVRKLANMKHRITINSVSKKDTMNQFGGDCLKTHSSQNVS